MADTGGKGWVAAAFAGLMPAGPDVPVHVRLVSAQCRALPGEPELAAEARAAAVNAAELAVTALRAGNLARALDYLTHAAAETRAARSPYEERTR